MSETYPSKRERWQRLRASLPAELRPHISLRNVQAVAGLPLQAQMRLIEAIRAGLKSLPDAIRQLKANPDTPVAELLNPVQGRHPQDAHLPEIQADLADLIQACYPDMPRLAAEALAGAEAMRDLRELAQGLATMLPSPQLSSDFVLVVLVALLTRTLERLAGLLADSPAARRVLAQTDPSDLTSLWRHSHA